MKRYSRSAVVGLALLATIRLAGPRLSLATSHRDAAPQGEVGDAAGISGVATDQSGAFVETAIATLSGREAHFERKLSTGQRGEFGFEGVPPGIYQLRVEKKGFRARYFRYIVVGPTADPEEEKLWETAVARPTPQHLFIAVELQVVTGMTVVDVMAKAGPRGYPEDKRPSTNPPPEYPEQARAQGVEGTVEVEVRVSPKGVPIEIRVMDSTNEILAKAAIEAVRGWRWQPLATGEGQAGWSDPIKFNFKLQR